MHRDGQISTGKTTPIACPSSEEFERFWKNWFFTLNKSGRNAPMKLRADSREALTMCTVSTVNLEKSDLHRFLSASTRNGIRRPFHPLPHGGLYGRINFFGGDQELRTPTLIREHPIRGEGHVDFLGESEGSLPPPQDSFPGASEAINDFWSMSGNFIFRHHVEPRVKFYSPREESFLVPLKYIDVSRSTHTNLDVKQQSRIDDCWNIDGSRDLSGSWTGFTQFTLSSEKPPDGYMWSGEKLTKR